jgi:predicted transposase/invertase (TIGR01784 family)
MYDNICKEAIADRQIQGNIAAASSVLAGLVLDNHVINQILRSDIMRESVVYQEILAEGEAKGEAKGKAEGEAKGKAEGKAEATKKFAANLLRMGMSLTQIAEATELTIEQVQVLQNELQQSN